MIVKPGQKVLDVLKEKVLIIDKIYANKTFPMLFMNVEKSWKFHITIKSLYDIQNVA